MAVGALCTTAPIAAGEAVSAEAAATDLPEIVQRSVDFHGFEAWRNSKVSFAIESKSGRFSVTSERRGDIFDDLVADESKGGARRVQVTNDQVRLWLAGVEQSIEPGDEQRHRDFVSARLYFPFLPFRLKDPGVRFADLGQESWSGRELHKIKVTFKAGSSTDSDDEYLYWFDPENGRLEQFAYSFHTGKGGLRFRRAFDHRRVGGILFFDSENWGVDGAETSVNLVNEAFVSQRMEQISTVRLLDLKATAPSASEVRQ